MITLMHAIAETEPTFAIVFEDNELAEACRESGAEVRTFYGNSPPPKNRLLKIVRVTRCLSKAILDWKIDLLHIHSATGIRYAWPAAKLHNIPILCHQRDNYKNDYFHRGIGLSDQIIAISQWVRDGLPKNLHPKTKTIYNGVRIPDIKLCKTETTSTPLRIGYAGRCFPEKGIDLLLSAATLLADRNDFSLSLWGIPSRTSDKLSDYAKALYDQISAMPASLKNRIVIEPFRKDIDTFYREADIVVVPSRFAEPMGRMAIEAMAWQRPTIVANHGGLSELVDHGRTGLVFEPNSYIDLSKQMTNILDNFELRNKIRETGREEAIKRFSAEQHLHNIRSVYQNLISK